MKKYLITVFFILALYSLSIFNIKSLTIAFKTAYTESNTLSEVKSVNQGMETLINDGLNVNLKHCIWDVYGIVCKALNLKIIGDFDIVLKKGSYLVGKESYTEENLQTEPFISEMEILSSETKKRGIDLLYIDIPVRNAWYDGCCTEVVNALSDLGIETISLTNIIPKASYNDYFYRTDGHITTESAWKIVEYLTKKYGIYDEYKMNLDNYEVVYNSFCGSSGRLIGKYNVKLDTFVRYIPKYETWFSYGKREYQYNSLEGGYTDTIMSKMSPYDGNCYCYYITDYLDYGEGLVSCDNKLVDNDMNVLVIGTSQGFQVAAYLSLFCDKLTFLDPRYGGVTALLTGDYDKVLVINGGSHYMNAEFSRYTYPNGKADIISTHADSTNSNLVVTVKNVGEGVWNEKNQVRLVLYKDGKDTGMRYFIKDGENIESGDNYDFVVPIMDFFRGDGTYSVGVIQEGVKYYDNPKEVMTLKNGEESS
ncbi:MAG: hypothetical protein E7309_04105 [Butyrivibrio sp.]|nr:hypothetical protein [Butyrivibrio sp.]